MKKLLVVLMVLTVATVANAGLQIGGIPTDPIRPSDTVVLSIVATGVQSPQDMYLFASDSSLGTVSGGAVVWSDFSTSLGELTLHEGADDMYVQAVQYYGWTNSMQTYYINLVGGTVPALVMNGTVVNNVVFHCEGAPGDVTIVLGAVVDTTGNGDYAMSVFDSQVIHQIPEPMTLGLLGLGGLFLRRRK